MDNGFWAANNVTFIEPAEGSIYHVGETMHVKFVLSPTDTTWSGAQLFDFYVDGGLMRGDRGVTTGSPYADSRRAYITKHKEFEWVIPDSLEGRGRERFSTVSDQCQIGTRPYPFTSNPVGAYGKSGFFTVLPATGASRQSAMRRQNQIDFFLIRNGETSTTYLCSGHLPVLVMTPDGRMMKQHFFKDGTKETLLFSYGRGMVFVKMKNNAIEIPNF